MPPAGYIHCRRDSTPYPKGLFFPTMPASFSPQELADCGLEADAARDLATTLNETLCDAPPPQRWQHISQQLLSPDEPFDLHRLVYERLYAEWPSDQGPKPAWLPPTGSIPETNLGQLMQELALPDYAALHAWSVRERDTFWQRMLDKLGIAFQTEARAIRGSDDPTAPDWLPGAELNIAESCFRADPAATAIVYQDPDGPLSRMTFGELQRFANRVANGLVSMGLEPGDAVAIDMPMHVEAVGIYLGIVLSGCVVVSISDSFSAEEIATRLRIAKARAIFTQQYRTQTHHPQPLYRKVKDAKAPTAIVLSSVGEPEPLREGDLTWEAFLSDNETFAAVAVPPGTTSNILFSSGTTGDPKAIPWSHTTPIRSAADGWLHHDIRAGDVVAWPTNLGWMMGPWLVYAALINRASIALYGGAPSSRDFGEFVRDAGVTMLGLVPSLVKAWRAHNCIRGLDWSCIRAFSSTGECSNADDYLYLMYLAGYRPVIEYCGGTEIGGAYITGTVVQPAAPATFSTPAMGLDFVILDEANQPTDNGEVYLMPPSIGLSDQLLNHDHQQVYFADTPPGPEGQKLRRHGDQIERLPGGYFRSHGRVDDTMNLKGVKVSSAELERTFNLVEGVKETAAIAVSPSGGGPSQLVIYVVLHPGQDLTTRKLKGLFKRQVRDHHNVMFSVHDVVITEALPRTASNKVMRRTLRATYQDEN